MKHVLAGTFAPGALLTLHFSRLQKAQQSRCSGEQQCGRRATGGISRSARASKRDQRIETLAFPAQQLDIGPFLVSIPLADHTTTAMMPRASAPETLVSGLGFCALISAASLIDTTPWHSSSLPAASSAAQTAEKRWPGHHCDTPRLPHQRRPPSAPAFLACRHLGRSAGRVCW